MQNCIRLLSCSLITWTYYIFCVPNIKLLYNNYRQLLDQVAQLQKQSNKIKIELEERRDESDRFKVNLNVINNSIHKQDIKLLRFLRTLRYLDCVWILNFRHCRTIQHTSRWSSISSDLAWRIMSKSSTHHHF